VRLAIGEFLLYSGNDDKDGAHRGRNHHDVENSTESFDMLESTRSEEFNDHTKLSNEEQKRQHEFDNDPTK
jgi:hypothetical protein